MEIVFNKWRVRNDNNVDAKRQEIISLEEKYYSHCFKKIKS